MKVKVLVGVMCMVLFASTSFAYDRATNYIRNCTFSKCKYKTVGESIDESLQNPRWESGKASDGELIVNVNGIVTWDGKRYNVMVQFAPTPNGFKTNGVAFNGKVMSPEFKSNFITQLCK